MRPSFAIITLIATMAMAAPNPLLHARVSVDRPLSGHVEARTWGGDSAGGGGGSDTGNANGGGSDGSSGGGGSDGPSGSGGSDGPSGGGGSDGLSGGDGSEKPGWNKPKGDNSWW